MRLPPLTVKASKSALIAPAVLAVVDVPNKAVVYLDPAASNAENERPGPLPIVAKL